MSPRRLTRAQFDAVIRRATELSAREGDAGELTEEELLRIAGDVGLDERHVREALVEVRSGGTQIVETGALDRLFGPETVRAVRVVPGTPGELAETLDEFLVAGRLLQAVRRTDRLLQYRPAVDWASQIARAASSTSRRTYVASARSVEVRLEPSGETGRTIVEMEVDPGTRGDNLAGAVFGGLFAGGGAGAGAGVLMAGMLAPTALAVGAGVLVGVGCASGVTWLVGRSHRKKVVDVQAEVEGILDQLEAGESPAPPPPSWMRWVKSQLQDARGLFGDDDGSGTWSGGAGTGP